MITDLSGWVAFWLLATSSLAFWIGGNSGFTAGKRKGYAQGIHVGHEFLHELMAEIKDDHAQAEINKANEAIKERTIQKLKDLGVKVHGH